MEKGVALILMIFLVLACSLVALVAFSLLTQGTESSLGFSGGVEAFAAVEGGRDWYLEKLASDSDWTDETDQTGIELGSGTFDITINSASANNVSFTVTGKVSGYSGQIIQRQISSTAKKTPKACLFAVFWQLDGPSARLDFSTTGSGTQIVGDYWSVGSSRINTPCSVTGGKVYYGSGETIDGTGTYSTEAIQPSFPDMPSLDTAYYDNLMSGWNTRINDANINTSPGAGDLTLTGNVNWTNQNISRRDINTNGFSITGTNFTVNCRAFNLQNGSSIDSNASNFTINTSTDFNMTGNAQITARDYRINCSRTFNLEGTAAINSNNFEIYIHTDFDTNGTVNVGGYGYIVTSVKGKILIHNANADAGTFTAAPSGGNIYFLSGGDMNLNSSQADTSVTLNRNCYLYSRSPSGTGDALTIRNSTTNINGAVIIAQRCLIVQDGAYVTSSTLYVDYASSASNNLLQIKDSGTTVSGAVISRGRNNQSLQINSGASVSGIVYQYGNSTEGLAQVNGNSSVTGSLLVRQFFSDSLGPATITYDASAVDSSIPQGLNGVSVEENSWNDN